MQELPALQPDYDLDSYIFQLSQAIQTFNPPIADYLSCIPKILYPDEKSQCIAFLRNNVQNISNLTALIKFFNEKIEDCKNETNREFLCLIGHVSYGSKINQPRSINHTTFWLKEFMHRKEWQSSARIFNLCKNFDTAVIQPLYEALEKNDLITLHCLLGHIESIQHYFSCENFQAMWIHHLLLLCKAIELQRFEAFFLLQSILLGNNIECSECTKKWFAHNEHFDKIWDIFNEVNIYSHISNSAQMMSPEANRFQLSPLSLLAFAFIPLFFIFFPWYSANYYASPINHT